MICCMYLALQIMVDWSKNLRINILVSCVAQTGSPSVILLWYMLENICANFYVGIIFNYFLPLRHYIEDLWLINLLFTKYNLFE